VVESAGETETLDGDTALHVYLLLRSVTNNGIVHLASFHMSLHLRWPWYSRGCERESQVGERAPVAVTDAGGEAADTKSSTPEALSAGQMNTNTHTNQTME